MQQQASLDIPPIQNDSHKKTCTLNKRAISGDDETDEYRMIHLVDKVDIFLMNQIINKDIGDHMINVIGLNLNYNFLEDIQKITDKGCLSPRGHK